MLLVCFQIYPLCVVTTPLADSSVLSPNTFYGHFKHENKGNPKILFSKKHNWMELSLRENVNIPQKVDYTLLTSFVLSGTRRWEQQEVLWICFRGLDEPPSIQPHVNHQRKNTNIMTTTRHHSMAMTKARMCECAGLKSTPLHCTTLYAMWRYALWSLNSSCNNTSSGYWQRQGNISPMLYSCNIMEQEEPIN